MNYEIITLEEKTVAGLKIRTNNLSPDCGEKIGKLWKDFFEGGIYASLAGMTTHKTIGLYTNYAGDEKDDYDMYVCCQVKEEISQKPDIAVTKIPAGSYAKFIVKGNMVTAVQEFWTKLWELPLNRKFTCDFEEYQPQSSLEYDPDHCEIHIYISLKEN